MWKKNINLLIFGFIMIVPVLQAQSDTIFNQTDSRNQKQGYWKKSYPNGKLMYKGFFKDNKPAGEMRRYYESGALKAIIRYDEGKNLARTRLFYEDGNLAATGNYINEQKDSIWTYYSYYEKSITTRESFSLGKRNGLTVHYYKNGGVSEKTEWKADKRSGIWEQYFQNNTLRLKAQYADNKLEGEFIVYYETGKPYISGIYKNDLREGDWKFFNPDGPLQKTMPYQMGKSPMEEKLDAEQQEFFKTIDNAQGKFEEPDETNFLNNMQPRQ
jgi:antitoxin component YwqK of YwqJK toxin-antitoxin module